MLDAFPGQEGGAKGVRINIGRIFDLKYINIQDGMYKKVDMANSLGTDEPTDEMGYHGKTQYQRTQVLNPKAMSKEDFITLMGKEKKMNKVMKTIKSIDKDHNGYITRCEFDDILKLEIPEIFDRELTAILNQFSSI